MKITNIQVENVLGIAHASVRTQRPIQLFCGHNHNGKTSLAEAVRFALVGDIEARGITLKKELGALVHDGAKSGSVEVQRDDGSVLFALLPSNKTTPEDVYVPHKALPYVLDPTLFGTLKPNDRRAFLFNLMGLRITPEVVIKKLAERGVDAEKAKRVGPLLRAGMDAAAAEAKSKATEAKGAWKQVTGETYGSEKSKDWKADVPAYDAAAAVTVATELKHIDVAIDGWNVKVGELQALEKARAELTAKRGQVAERAALLERREKKLAADRKSLEDAEAELARAVANAEGGPRQGLVHELAWAVDNLIFFGGSLNPDEPQDARILAALANYEREFGKVVRGMPEADTKAAARIPELRETCALMDRTVGNSQRDVADSLRARDELAEIDAKLAEEFDAAGLADARAKVAEQRAQRDALVKRSDALKNTKTAADNAERKTKEAAAHYADVVAWEQIAAALAPDGIPSEMLNEAIHPFNERLLQAAMDSEWARIEITPDMEIQGGLHERPYKLLSESEKWRADAMLAEAISHLSGLKLLMLDRFDVLDLKGREDLLAWLEVLAANGELDTALLFGTLKALPQSSESMDTHWIEAGAVGQMKAAA